MTEGKIALRPGCWLEKIQLCSFCQWLLAEWLDRVGWAPGAAGPCRAAVPVSPWLERKVHLRLLTPALAKATEVAFFFFFTELWWLFSHISLLTDCMLGTDSCVHHSLYWPFGGRRSWSWMNGGSQVHRSRFFGLDALGSQFRTRVCTVWRCPWLARNNTVSFRPSKNSKCLGLLLIVVF